MLKPKLMARMHKAFVCFLLLASAPAMTRVAFGQSSGPSYWVQERQLEDSRRARMTRPHIIRVQPSRSSGRANGYHIHHFARPAPTHAPNAAPAANAATNPVPAAPAVITPPDFFVAVMGNGISLPLAAALTDTFATTHPDMAFQKDSKPLSGLVRADFFDWAKSAQAILNAQPAIQLGIMMVGTNDRQPILDGANYVQPFTPRWSEIYAQRVAAIDSLFQQKHVPLIWVGLPIVRSPQLSTAYIALNDIYRAQAAKTGATYIDIWDAFLSETGTYEANGPNVNGDIVKLRMFDGIHFTQAGARKIAHFLEAAVQQAYLKIHPADAPTLTSLLPAPGTSTPDSATPAANVDTSPLVSAQPVVKSPAADLGALIQLEIAGLPPGSDAQKAELAARLKANPPLPQQPSVVVIKTEPAEGKVMLLRAPQFGSDNALLDNAQMAQRDAKVREAFENGNLPEAEPGRPGAFAWPPH
ncbi:MAG: DUF459 domain-containing protein [Hyphomicrobiales bacterium]|nr:DUF459 domain-containing protein [Hyphomicrobiales bacterium]MDE2115861.1 DUF459 domain-containing protein [Hyphomicrobiales bacterium]